MNCPHCKTPEVVIAHVSFTCTKGHKWSEDVELPSDTPALTNPGPPLMNIRPRATPEPFPVNPGLLTMPFGKHKGQLIEDLPLDYIMWCLENVDRLSPNIRNEMENQVLLKEGKGVKR